MTQKSKKEYDEQYRLKNRERIRLQHREFESRHPDYRKQYRLKNREKINKRSKERRLKNLEKYREYSRKFYAKNKEKYSRDNKSLEEKEKLRARDKIYRLKNPEKHREQGKKWYHKNREDNLKKMKAYREDPKNRENFRKLWRAAMKRRIADPNTQIRHNLRVRMKSVLKGIYKSAGTMKLVGCTVEELWKHLESCSSWESWMTRENYGKGGWDVDHIKACAKFDLTDPVQQRICFHWSNLQPLEHIENLKKGAR